MEFAFRAFVIIACVPILGQPHLDDQGELTVVAPNGIDGVVSVFEPNGRLILREQCSGRTSLELPADFNVSTSIFLSFEAQGILPQCRAVDRDSYLEGLEWSPRVRSAGVFLFAAEARDSRHMKPDWPRESYSLSRSIGRALPSILGISDHSEIEAGFYLTGDVRVVDGHFEWNGAQVSASFEASNLSRPLSYSLSVTPFGSTTYPVHVLPIDVEAGLSDFDFLFATECSTNSEPPEMIGLKLETSDGVESVVALRQPGTTRYRFRSKSQQVKVLGSLFGRWDLMGISSGSYVQLELKCNSLRGSAELPVLKEREGGYLRFPSAWGASPIPGLMYSISSLEGFGEPIDEQFFIEGGGAFVPPGKYQLGFADSSGQLGKVSSEVISVSRE